jgi:flagellar biosynthesis protein
VALRYSEDEQAPKIVASGAGELAKKILKLAAEHNIPVRQDDSLADILSQLELGMEVPEETFRAVAEIFSFLYRSNSKYLEKHKDIFAGSPLSGADSSSLSSEESR